MENHFIVDGWISHTMSMNHPFTSGEQADRLFARDDLLERSILRDIIGLVRPARWFTFVFERSRS